ncbi:MAG: adenine phosphoribosyltransferase [Planctomycetaceae bacterium]|jgi:adenine phosphoribosyltransferase|nr:adenine phosphoribosyltransferase [Planctomycetaceae bacterium]
MNLSDYIRTVTDFPIAGIKFRDITPLLQEPQALAAAIDQMIELTKEWGKVDLVAAPEARGFVFAVPIAMRLGVGFVPIRKPGKLPYKTVSKSYGLEYGVNTVQMHSDAVKSGTRVLIVDDLLATGGTMDACRQLIEENGGVVVGGLFLIELIGLNGRENLKTKNIGTLLTYPA